MRLSLAAAALLPAAALAQAAGPDEGAQHLPYLWVWIVATALVLFVLGLLLFGGGLRDRARANASHRARRELHGS